MRKFQYFAAYPHKIFVSIVSAAALVLTIGSVYLVIKNGVSPVPFTIFGVIYVCIQIRTLTLFRYPAVEFDGTKLQVRGWFGAVKCINIEQEAEVVYMSNGIMLKQGKTAVVILIQVLGKDQFDGLLQAISDSRDGRWT